MREFTERLMTRGQMAAPGLPAAIFGTAGSEGQILYAGQPAVRIGLWPLRSAGQPELAMGLFALVGYLLERWRGARVYRLAARVEGDARQWRWTMASSQFGVDDWQPEGLDDNVGIWGALEREGQGYRLRLNVEDDRLAEDEAPAEFQLEAGDLAALVGGMPALVGRVAARLGLEARFRNAPLYGPGEWAEEALEQALRQAFWLELQLCLQMWGQPWPTARAREALQQLAGLAGEFGAWLGARCSARCLRDSEDGEALATMARRDGALAPATEAAAIIVAEALFARGSAGAAIELLEAWEAESSAAGVSALADMYRRSGRASEAVEVLQDAIEAGRSDVALLVGYGDLLQAMELSGLDCETSVYVDAAEAGGDWLLWEALAAWEAAQRLAPEDAEVLQRILVTLAELGSEDERFWRAFERLVALEGNGEALRQVIDACAGLESLAPARRMLQEAFRQRPEELELGLNLAEVLVLEQEEGALAATLAQLRSLAGDEEMQAELARLELLAEEPEFELRLGEIEGVLAAGNALRSEALEWLEGIIGRAPGLGGMHALLARAWLAWGEDGAALETTLDGYQRFPGDAELAALLGEQLWQAGEAEAAFKYLGAGLAQNPDDVLLLALTGQYLFEDGQGAAARSCLARAEALAPQHPALAQARRRIAAG